MEVGFLARAKAHLMTVSQLDAMSQESRMPAVVVFADLPEEDFDIEVNAMDLNQLPGYQITDISAGSSNTGKALLNVFFDTEEKPYRVRIPIQFLSVATSLEALREPFGGVPILFVDSKTTRANPGAILPIDKVSFALFLPVRGTDEGDEFSEKLSGFIDEEFVVPLAPVAWDAIATEEENEAGYALRESQSRIMMNLMGLARGDVLSFINLFADEAMFEAIDSKEEGDPEIIRLMDAHLDIVLNAYRRIMPLNPKLRSAGTKNDSNLRNDAIFHNIAKNAGIESVFEQVEGMQEMTKSDDYKHWSKNVMIWNTPFSESWPEQMVSIKEYLESVEDGEVYAELADRDYSDIDVIKKTLAEYGRGKVYIALCLYLASKVLAKAEVDINDSGESVSYALTINNWVNFMSDDEFAWELPAVARSLASYDIRNAVDVFNMFYYPDKVAQSPNYLWEVIYILGHHLFIDEEWANDDMASLSHELEQAQDNTSEFANAKKWLLEFYSSVTDNLSEEGELHHDGGCAVASALQEIMGSEPDVEGIAESVAYLMPVLADVVAGRLYEFGTDEWSNTRIAYIHHMLSHVAQSVGPRSSYAE